MMIFKRRRASQKRFDRVGEAKEMAAMGRAEERFEEELGLGGGRKKGDGWGREWEGWLRETKGKEVKEYRRNEVRFFSSPSVLSDDSHPFSSTVSHSDCDARTSGRGQQGARERTTRTLSSNAPQCRPLTG
jgi:hypothetical protein